MGTIVFISLYDRNAHGQRLMSANLKRAGHDVHMIFLKRYSTNRVASDVIEVGEYPWTGINERGQEFKYATNSLITAAELQILRDLLERIDPDVIGMTVNTPLRLQNTRVTQFIKSFSKVPVVWGGYDPTVNPTQCLPLCDYACVGEGDTTMLQIAECIGSGDSFDRVCNLAYIRDGRVLINRKSPLLRDLDALPWRDNTSQNKYFIEDGVLEENHAALNDRQVGSYQAMTSRGCPYRCTYCCEASLKDSYVGEKFLRRRSPSDCVSELRDAISNFDINEIVFEDEIFGMDLKWVSEFVPIYKKMVDLPFIAYIYPTRNIGKLLPLLKSAGLKYCCLALESGSTHINQVVFDRVYDRDLFLKTVFLCKQLEIEFYTDVITYNPYEEERDLQDTLDVLLDMRGGFDMCVNKLFILPGTRLAQQVRRDGKDIPDESKDKLFNYYCRLFWIASFSPNAGWAVRVLKQARLLRSHPQFLHMGLVEWVLRGPIGRAINGMARDRCEQGRSVQQRPEVPTACP